MASQVCYSCKVEKDLKEENFAKKKGSKSGFDSRCKECKRKQDAERYGLKRDKILEQKRKYYQRKKGRGSKNENKFS